MKRIEWSKEKNKILQRSRNVCFEQIADIINNNKAIHVIEHPNKQKYPNQKLLFVNINGYVYFVPFVEDDEKVFLKTIVPSRKATKKFIIKNK